MSTSNIIVKVRYKVSSNRTKSIKSWCDYVSKKEKADSISLDNINILEDYINHSKNTLDEMEECFLWNENGNLNSDYIKDSNIDSDGIIWDMVLSFPQDFAYKNGLITKKDFFELTKNVIPLFLTDLGFDLNNVSWTAGLHRNSKNPHIHLSFYEHKKRNSFKTIPYSNISKLKSYIANYIVDNEKFYKLRDKEFDNIVKKLSLKEFTKIKNRRLFADKYRKDLNKLLLSLYSELPEKGRLQYNSKNMIKYKDKLDYIIRFILSNDPIKYNYQLYYNALEEHQKKLKEMYGNSNSNKNNDYLNNQLNKLYSKIGNDILNNFKSYQSKEQMEKEILFMKKNINELKFKSSNYVKESKIIEVGKALYKICNMCDLNYSQTKKVFERWIKNSKFNYDVYYILNKSSTLEDEMSITDYYKYLKKMGYSYERIGKLKEKQFYKEINYKLLVNNAINHLMYEYEKENKAIEKEMEYELESI